MSVHGQLHQEMAHPHRSDHRKVGRRHACIRPEELITQPDHRAREAHAHERVAVRVVVRVREASRARDDGLVEVEGLEAGEGEEEEERIGGAAGEGEHGERDARNEGFRDQGWGDMFEAVVREWEYADVPEA